jgi:2-polyprenyl-6-methoxyphenol hydroxylase-like FAD-dependent oxidoreductase
LLLLMNEMDAVVVGAGPVGLFFALQLKYRTGMSILMLEKYEEYQRKHVLNIELASFATTIRDIPELEEPLADLVGKVPTGQIEATLKRLALDAGVQIRTGVHVESVDKLEVDYPGAKYYIGADGRRSVMRMQRFGDNLCYDYRVMRIVFCKYEVSGETRALDWWDYIQLSMGNENVKHTVNELVGKSREGTTAVTLQFHVSEEEFNNLDGFTAKSPATIDDVLQRSPTLGPSVRAWFEHRVNILKEKVIGRPRINPVPLDVYQAASVVCRGSKGKVWALIGDAAFGLPFFRALNDGLQCASSLATAITEDFKAGGAQAGQASDPIESYAAFFKVLTQRYPCHTLHANTYLLPNHLIFVLKGSDFL